MKRITDRAFLACLLAVLIAVPALVALWSHRQTTAYYENRTLAQRPSVTAAGLWDGSFTTEFDRWYSDHIPGRTTLLKADTAVELKLLRRPVVNGMVVQEKLLLPEMDFDEYTPQAYLASGTPIAEDYGKLNAWIDDLGGTLYFVGFPEQRVYFEDDFPTCLNSHAAEAEAADTIFFDLLSARGVRCLDMEQVYDAAGHPAAYYSTVDHHYTYYGAYAAYRAILERLASDGVSLPTLTEDDLTFEELPNPYIGSRNRKLYNLWENSEKAVVGVQKEPVAFTRYDNGSLSDKPLFVTPAAPDLPTSYNLYMGGDFGETILETNRPELPDVLIFGDSFTNALETLLYASFDETRILDLRHYTGGSLQDYIAAYQPDIVLSIQNDTYYYTPTGNGAVWED